MAKTNEQLLKDLIKSNKERKQQLVQRAGFETPEQYKEYLVALISGTLSSPKKSKVETPLVKPTIHVVELVDRSGSMHGGKLSSAITGVNSEIEELKKVTDVNYTFTLVEFDDKIRSKYFLKPIKDVGKYVTSSGGTTALHQAIGETLTSLKSASNGTDKFLIKIFTDGGENASRGEFQHPSTIAKLIKEVEGKGFTVTFVGTAGDVKHIQGNLKIDESNTLTHDNTSSGVLRAFTASNIATQSYSKKVLAGEDVLVGFYSKKVGKL